MISRNALIWLVCICTIIYKYDEDLICIACTTIGSNKNSHAASLILSLKLKEKYKPLLLTALVLYISVKLFDRLEGAYSSQVPRLRVCLKTRRFFGETYTVITSVNVLHIDWKRFSLLAYNEWICLYPLVIGNWF